MELHLQNTLLLKTIHLHTWNTAHAVFEMYVHLITLNINMTINFVNYSLSAGVSTYMDSNNSPHK